MQWLGLVVVLVACSSPSHTAALDAAKPASDAPDVALDAPPDTPPDAPIVTASPRCTTTPSILVETSPRQIGNMARVEDTLYVSAYQIDNTTISDNVYFSIDLTTGTVSSPTAADAQIELWSAGDNVYASEYQADGTIWQLHPGNAPVALIQHLDTPTVVTADTDYVYWASTANVVQRRLITGGPIEMVMPCTGATKLIIDGDDMYCAGGSYVVRAPKAGGVAPIEISTTITSYPITSMIKDGALYYINLDPFPDLLEIDSVNNSATVINKLTVSGRYSGLAASSNYFYISDLNNGLRRIQRTTQAVETIVPGYGVYFDPVLWNQSLLYEAQNPQVSGERYVMQCVD